ncbi:MAG: ATP synthase F1 subunit epsilon [Oscillospiraceae bacterium]|nr:ATP synthase F1 subunit epsilon [Oscillospiraceae bacterium]
MATDKMRLRIVTPKNVKFDGDADMVILRCVSGDMGVLPRHETYSAVLDSGALRILNNKEDRKIVLSGGLAQIRDNTVTVLTNDAQWPEEKEGNV